MEKILRRVTKKQIQIVCIILFAIILFKPAGRLIISISNQNNQYNINQIQYVLHPADPIRRNAVEIPWGISKFEVKFFEERKLVDEDSNILIYGPYLVGPFWSKKEGLYDNFIEYHFNNDNQLYKVIMTTGNKYYLKENRPKLAKIYNDLKKEKEKAGEYLVDSISFYISSKGYFNLQIDAFSISTLNSNDLFETEELDYSTFWHIYNSHGNGTISTYKENNLNINTVYSILRYSNDIEFHTYYYVADDLSYNIEENVMVNMLLLSN